MTDGSASGRLGRFHLVEPLGGGPCGEVFRAKVYGVAGFERQYAVKRLLPSVVANPRYAAALSAAARAYGGLEHPRIAKLAEFGVSGGDTFTATELCDGADVGRLIEELQLGGRKLAAGAALSIVSQAARAVGYAHGRGVAHLGLSPTNLIISDEGNVRITDVGILGACLPEKPAHDDRLALRIPYLAPEQLVGDATTPATDVFVLGAIACELVSGVRAFGGESPVDIAQAVLGGAPHEPELPRPLLKVLQRCLARSPIERFPDARSLADAIDAAQRMAPVLGGRADLAALVALARERRTQTRDQSGAFTMNLPSGAVTRTATQEQVTRMERPIAATNQHEEATETTPFMREDTVGDEAFELGAPGVGAHNTLVAMPAPVPRKPTTAAPPLPAVPSLPIASAANGGEPPPRTQKVGTMPLPGNLLRPAPVSAALAAANAASALPVVTVPPILAAPKALGIGPSAPIPETEPLDFDAIDATTPVPPQFEMPPMPAARNFVSSAGSSAVDRAAPTAAIVAESTSVVRPLDAPVAAGAAPAPAPARRSKVPVVIGTVCVLSAALGAVGYVWMADGGGGAAGKQEHSASATKPVAVAVSGSGSGSGSSSSVGSGSGSSVGSGSGSSVGSGSAIAEAGSGSGSSVGSGSAIAEAGSGSAIAEAGSGSAIAEAGSGSAAVPVAVDPPSAGRYRVASSPPGALVLLDGAVQGNTPLELAATGDSHTLALMLPGYALHVQELSGNASVDATLKAVTPTGAPAGIKIRCKVPDRYYVYVDGADTGMMCPSERIEVTLGAHTVEVYDLVTETRRQFPVVIKETRNSLRVKVDE